MKNTLSVLFLTLVLLAVSASQAVAASPVFSSTYVFDDFDSLPLIPDSAAYWHVINWGDENGTPRAWYESYTGDASSVTAESSNGTTFSRLRLTPDSTPGFYTNAEIAEQKTGYESEIPGKWQPTAGHPVVLETRVRWSGNYNTLATGAAVGSSGVWLWNSPVDSEGDGSAYGNIQAFGFNWSQQGSALFGLNAIAIRGVASTPVPVFVLPMLTVNMNNWNTFKIVWSQGLLGLHTLTYYLNGNLIGVGVVPAMDPLSVEVWNDNQKNTLVASEPVNPTEIQDMEIDYLKVFRQ